MEHQTSASRGLPDNAYRELPPGQEYEPIMKPTEQPAEVTPYSVMLGLLMAVLFSAAAAYSGLKIGQVFEAAIPIAILAVGISAVFKPTGAMGQNVIIQSIGASSGVIVAGAIFTIPALYILDLPASFFQVFFASALGGFLGILFLIPFRKFFVKDMHGKFPFPEATATTEILVAGEKGGAQARVLVVSGLIGGLFDFLFSAFGMWSEVITTRMIPAGAMLADKAKMVFKLNVSSMIFGLGYIVGLKYSAIIAAGSFLSWFVLVPLFAEIGSGLSAPLGATATKLISQMSAEEIFRAYVRQIGIGGIAMAGIIGILRSSRIIGGAFSLAYREIFHRSAGTPQVSQRTQADLPMLFIVTAVLLTALMIFVFFYAGVVFNAMHAVVGLSIVLLIAFLFTTVAANAIAIVGTNPVSGMTLMTLILSSFVLVNVGLTGTSGMISALIIGGVVCTALSVAGGFITDLKIGYWLGTTPRKQETWKFLGVRRLGGHGRRGDLDPERNLRLQGRSHGRAAGQRHGGGDPAADVEHSRPMDAVRPWRGDLPAAGDGEDPPARLRAGDVYPAGTEHPPALRGTRRLVGDQSFHGREAEQCQVLAGHADRVGVHRRGIVVRRGERPAPLL